MISDNATLPLLLKNSKKPSEFIRTKQDYKIRITSHVPVVTELLKETVTNCSISIDKPLFQPEPSSLSIEGFAPFKTYDLMISFRNVDKVPRKIRVEQSNNPFFTVQGWKKMGLQSEKVAPGMEVQYIIKFLPEERVDYFHELICETEREKFIVPIKAVGARGYLDFPDQLVFSESPVNYATRKIILVRNVGDIASKFTVDTQAPFSVTPKEGYLSVASSIQFTITFFPKQTGSFESKLLVDYDTGDQMAVDLMGTVSNINIRIDKSSLSMKNTISLTSNKIVRLQNKSNLMVKFSWKKFSNQQDEDHVIARHSLDLAKQEHDEMTEIMSKSESNQLAVTMARRKFLNKQLAAKDYDFSFSDAEFRIEPSSGTLWPGSFIDFNVFFSPLMVGDYNAVAFCEVQGRESRLPLQLTGKANGPNIKFSYTAFRIGEIFINTMHKYEILLENVGNIKSNFTLLPNKNLFGPKFQFIPCEGTINVGEQLVIDVIFHPDILGNFKEVFYWKLEGGSENLYVSFSGDVVGPTFAFDCEKLIFPHSSFGFEASKEFKLTNTSQIPMEFNLLILDEDNEIIKDFKVIPSSGKVEALDSISLILEFFPSRVDTFKAFLVANILAVGDDLLRLPIEAKSVVPEITLKLPHVELKDCFLDYSYVDNAELVNDTPFKASFVIPTKENSRNSNYFYSFDIPEGIIQPHSSFLVPFTLRVKRLGSVSVPFFINIVGSSSPPLAMEVTAIGVGSTVIANMAELNWGKIPVLTTVSQNLTLENTSPICAEFNCASLSNSTVFTIHPLSGKILPGEKAVIEVNAFLDDTTKFTDVLKINILSSNSLQIPMIARGHGSTIVFDEGQRNIDFHDVFSNQECSASFTMYNKGRKTQVIGWCHLPSKDPEVIATQIFEVIPQRFTLKPRSHQVVYIKSRSNIALKVNDKLLCFSNTEKDPTRKLLLETNVSVNFINPLVKVSPPMLNFVSIHTSDDHFETLFQQLKLKNTTSLALTMNISCLEPFRISEEDSSIWLAPESEAVVVVSFNPSHHYKRISVKETGKIIITYAEHSQKDYISLSSEVYFPNLTFDTSLLVFGCIQNHIQKRKVFKISNTSTLPVFYQWHFVETDPVSDTQISQAFDIRPLHGQIDPGNFQEVSVFFYGHPEGSFDTKAFCDVAGGPKYELPIQGNASTILYSIEKTEIDFETISYQAIVEQEIWIENQGSVSFEFKVTLEKNSGIKDKVMITPAMGIIHQNSRQKLLVRFCPGVPEIINDSFFVQVGDYEPRKITVMGKGVFPRLEFNGLIRMNTFPSKSEVSTAEQDRIYLKERTLEYIAALKPHPDAMSLNNDMKYVGSSLLFHTDVKKEKNATVQEYANVHFGTYIFDLGTVVRNSATTKTFSVTNSGSFPVSFSLQKNALANSGFSLEPEKIKNLPPGESLDLTASFVAKIEGDISTVEVPVMILGGPTVNIRLTARSAIPELKVNEGALIDFGEIFQGFRKSMVLQVENPSAVGCDWTFLASDNEVQQSKKRPLYSYSKDFEVMPSSGFLEPFSKSTLVVRFAPKENRIYDTMLSFKVAMNPKVVYVHVRGIGSQTNVVFEPASVLIGPVLPYADGLECRVTISNAASIPIELFCTNFDSQHKSDDEMLKQLEFNESGIIYCHPRDLDMSFSDYLHDLIKRKTQAEKPLDSGKPFFSKVGDLNTNMGSDINLSNDCNFSIIIHGPPLSGKTSSAKKLAALYGKQYISFDMIVEQTVQISGSQEQDNAKFGSEELELKAWEDAKNLYSDEILFDIIKTFFQDNFNPKGYVLDGLECKYNSNISSLLKIVLKAFLEKGRRLYIFHLIFDAQKLRERELILQAQTFEKKLASLRVKELSEEEYDFLSQPEKDAYDTAMQKYKRKVKEIEEKRHKERRAAEEDPNQKVGEKKNQSDDSRKNRRAGNSIRPPTEKEKAILPPKEKTVKASLPQKPPSPKLGRKAEKHESDRSPHRDNTDELPFEESFASELIYRRVDLYLSTIDTAISLFRDGKDTEKVATKQAAANPVLDKKKAKQELTPVNHLEAEALIIEDINSPGYHEIQVSNIDESLVLKAMVDIVPQPKRDEVHKGSSLYVSENWLEQMIQSRPTRLKQANQKVFSIVSGFSVSDEIQDGSGESTIGLPTIATPASFIKNTDQSKLDAKKGTKIAIKQYDDKGLDQDDDNGDKEGNTQYRWILGGGEKKDIFIRYNPIEAIKSELVLNFEIPGWNQEYRLPLAGICHYSQIVTEFKKIFEKCTKMKDEKEVIHGEFVLSSSTYEFGPLLHNKPRDKYLERFPENKASVTLTNPGQAEAKLIVCLKSDIKQDTFFFEPQTVSIAPGKSSVINIWAYPKSPAFFEDSVIITVADNPEPLIFKISCTGVKPELEVDRKAIAFEKLLVGRSDKKEIKIKNPSAMAVYWRIVGLELLGEEFAVSPIEGIIESLQDLIITAEFHGSKAFVTKRIMKIEVYDSERIAGIVQEIPIVVTAEAYDIAIDIHFPKGFDGGVDFGVIKVIDEGKQLVTLKNKGKYEIGFKFLFDAPYFADFLTITPLQGIIQPSDKPFFVQIIFKSQNEMTFKDFPFLKCIVFEPATGEITASIPVKVSGKAVFSKYAILPVRDLNFGALVHGTKATKQFAIENTGEFDFRFNIYKLVQSNGKKIRAASPPPSQKVKKDPLKQADMISFGSFSVFPSAGAVSPGTKHFITVDFHADVPGSYEDSIGIEITDRPPSSANDVIEYQLLGESCIPGINTTDFQSIFEEQIVCSRLELFKTQNNAYGEEDRAFFFGAYLAGQQIQVHFKISNPFKVGCEVLCATKPRGKTKSEIGDFAFDLEPKKLTIPSHEHRYVTVMFHPTSIQTYSGVFEACVENVLEGKNKLLTFELRGEGTLPRVSVEKPLLKSKTGLPLLKFRKLMIGASQTLSILFKNDGIIPSKMKLEWAFKDNDDFFCSSLNDYQTLKPGESRSVDIKCQPSSIRKLEGELRLKVVDNLFEDSSIFITGEGYLDDMTIEGFPEESENELSFTDCYIGETKSLTFKLKNHSNDWLRASFVESVDFLFSPNTCHIKPKGGERDITVSFSPKASIDIQKVNCLIKTSKIRLVGSAPEIEWDDRMKVVRWNNSDKGPQKKVTEPIQEPVNEILSQLNDFQIILNGYADYSSYECECSKVHFKSTLMFQNRVYRFPIRNVGKVSIKFSCEIFEDENFQVVSGDSPFSITPSFGKVLPGEVIIITVRFSPIEVGEYSNFIFFNMANLVKDMKPLVIQVDGYSLRPFCHFELEDTDPISIESRTPERSLENGVPIVLEPNTKIIEFKSCGVKVKNTKRFYIVNPTQSAYDFIWKHESVNDSKAFKCLTVRGNVASGKKSEIIFEYYPETLDTKESLWTFILPDHKIRIPFLLIGYATEPNVYISQAGVNFRSVLVGRQVRESIQLVNDEETPFAFNFDDNSGEMGNEGHPVLKFNPISGTIPAQSEIPIEIIFFPPEEKLFNFNLVCNIRKKPSPISVNIKGEGYKIHDSLCVEMADGSNYELSSDGEIPNQLDFGLVQINDRRVKRIIISNTGKYNFDFSWKLFKKAGPMSISPEIGTVMKGEKVYCELCFCPTSYIQIKDFRLSCHILNGKSYPISVLATGTKPLIKMNVQTIEFGTQFILRGGNNSITRNLEVTNNDITEMAFEIITPELHWLDFPKGIYTLAPSETKSISVEFTPKDPVYYSDTIKFEVNGLSVVEVPVSGEGSDFRVEVENLNVGFGALRIGQTTFKTVKIFSRSKIAAPFSLGPSSTMSRLSSMGVTFSQLTDFVIRPKSAITLDIKFFPQKRVSPFSEEIVLEFFGYTKSLFVLSGACQGIEVRLENDTLPFGAVVKKSLTSRKLQLQNIGDIGAKFSWDSLKLYPNFSITPMEGYISPGMEIPLEITFHPIELNPDIRAENVQCLIEGSSPATLTLSGMCIPQPAHSDILKFLTPARTPETKSVVLSNKTNSPWSINPIIDNDSWSGPDLVEVEPGQSKSYEITFNPVVSIGTGELGRHEGSIFFPLPDGSGILYRLNGLADKPLPAGNITREIPCKVSFTEVIQVTNWLRRPQKFRIVADFAKPDGSILFKGHDFIELSPLLTKDYKYTFYSYKEGSINFRVIFKNEATTEYIYYNIMYKSTAPGITSTLEITAPIRMLQTREVSLSNPLPTPVVFSGTSNNAEVSIPHTFVIPPKADSNFTIEFLPLQPKESTARINLTSQELGTYQYDLKLNAIPSGLERSLHFKAGLGNLQVQTFRFQSYAKVKTEYTCKIESGEFSVDKIVAAPPANNVGVEISIDVTYEPCKLGDTRTQLIVSSPIGGDYICPLFGHCILPKPQGPISIKQGSTSFVTFKNVFNSSAVFNCVVDNPAFQVKSSETIPSKKVVSISIGYKLAGPSTEEKEKPKEKGDKGEKGEKGDKEKEKVGASAGSAGTGSSKPLLKIGKLTVTNPATSISWLTCQSGSWNKHFHLPLEFEPDPDGPGEWVNDDGGNRIFRRGSS